MNTPWKAPGFLSAISPDYIRLRTFVPVPSTPLYEDYRQAQVLTVVTPSGLAGGTPAGENLQCNNSMVLSDHVSNYWDVHGLIPQDREEMLADLDQAFCDR